MTPEALRRRMAHGNVYPAERIDTALGNYFRAGNLGALRELALLWVADRVDEALDEYRRLHGIERPWETRERVLVALTGAPDGDRLVRRAARMAQRAKGDLVAVHVRPQDGLTSAAAETLERQRTLVERLGGTYRDVVGDDIGKALVDTARRMNATQIVLGATRRSRVTELAARLGHRPRDPRVGRGHRRPCHQPGGGHRRAAGPPAANGTARPPRDRRSGRRRAAPADADDGARAAPRRARPAERPPPLSARRHRRLGDRRPLARARRRRRGFLLANWYFTPPLYTFTIGEGENLLALAIFLIVAATVSGFVSLAARRANEGQRARAEAESLARLAGTSTVLDILESIRRTFALDGVTLWHRRDRDWTADAEVGAHAERTEAALRVDGNHVLALVGPTAPDDERRLLDAFVTEFAGSIRIEELEADVSEVDDLERVNDLRLAILSAVSHDLRTPLAGIKASVTSLLDDEIDWPQADRQAFLSTIDQETDRLDGLVGNLLDMSRLQSGALDVASAHIGLDEVVPAALASIGPQADAVDVDVAETLPRVVADPGLLERAIANIVANALVHGDGAPVRVVAGPVDGGVDLRVVDRGPGVSAVERDRMFVPFQRLGDSPHGASVGLGLAVARGFLEAMGGTVEVEDTPGGGLTMILRLRTAP